MPEQSRSVLQELLPFTSKKPQRDVWVSWEQQRPAQLGGKVLAALVSRDGIPGAMEFHGICWGRQRPWVQLLEHFEMQREQGEGRRECEDPL